MRRTSRCPIAIERLVALSLLLVLLTGLSIVDLTRGWVGLLPNHDHLLYAARAIGLVHHAHPGDALDRAERALRPIPLPSLPGHPTTRVVSLRRSTAQPELNTFTAQGQVASPAPQPPPQAGLIALFAVALVVAGIRRAPPAPPPRLA